MHPRSTAKRFPDAGAQENLRASTSPKRVKRKRKGGNAAGKAAAAVAEDDNNFEEEEEDAFFGDYGSESRTSLRNAPGPQFGAASTR